jgi:hypothetical protein
MLASRVPDYEQQFDAFCWDILLRLKLDNTTVCDGDRYFKSFFLDQW